MSTPPPKSESHSTDDLREAPSRSWALIRELWPIFLALAGAYTSTVIGAVWWAAEVESRLESIERTQPSALRERVTALETQREQTERNVRDFWEREWPELKSEMAAQRIELRELRTEMLEELRFLRRAVMRDATKSPPKR